MSAPDSNTANTVLYALSTVAQTCAALAALVGALALFKLQTMRGAHDATARTIIDLAHGGMGRLPSFDEALRVARDHAGGKASGLPQGIVAGLRAALAEWDSFDTRYAEAVRVLIGFEAWNLFTILAALLGFACVPWLAAHWMVFMLALVILGVGTVGVTGCAVYVIARRQTDESAAS